MRARRRARQAALLGWLVSLALPAFAASDAQLARRIEARLAKAGFDQRGEITVDVESGIARLTGFVLRWIDVREADRLASKDVRSVVNLLRVVPEHPRSDSESWP